ncbi:hypothetical protein [Streptomyces sp. NPDC002962]|uniref:hypothetical protein n=1 Tax=Streptomyces sp. NPDC002962 TaxID=3364674 RepID=UPI0036D083F7
MAAEWPELRGRPAPRLVSDPVAARLRVGHTLTVTETRLQFLLDARRRGEVCRPLDFLPEVHHPVGSGEAVIPDALMGPERLAVKLRAYARLHHYVPTPVGRRRTMETVQGSEEEWRRHYPLFPRLLFILDGTGPAGIDNRLRALHAADVDSAVALFLREVIVLAAPMTDLLQPRPAATVRRPARDPEYRVALSGSRAFTLTPSKAIDRGICAPYRVVCVDVTDTALQAAQLLGAEGRSAEVRGARLAALQTALVKASAEEGFRRTLVLHHVVKEAEAFVAGLPASPRS